MTFFRQFQKKYNNNSNIDRSLISNKHVKEKLQLLDMWDILIMKKRTFV